LTDSDDKSSLCSGIHCGILQKQTVVCALLDDSCKLLVTEYSSKDSSIKFEKKAEFIADKAKAEPGVNCCCFTRESMMVTGGEDNTCRVWKVSTGKKPSDEWNTTLEGEMAGHTKPIMALSLHPLAPWVCSASKDGTCKIWNTSTKTLLLSIPYVDGLAGVGSANANKTAVQYECRGCCFSVDGKYLYTIQSARRGATHLIKWELEQQGDKKKELVAVPYKYVQASKIPSTRLKLNDTGTLLALGTAEGEVVIFNADNLTKVSTKVCHDLPVTGMGFAPSQLAVDIGKRALVVSCSADRLMATLQIADPMSALTMVLVIAALVLFLFMLANCYQIVSVLIL
jgi:WD40 repeat protein